MVHPDLMRGHDDEGAWVRCEMCGAMHRPPWDGLAVDRNGVRVDVCAGDCARQAGLDSDPADGFVRVATIHLPLTVDEAVAVLEVFDELWPGCVSVADATNSKLMHVDRPAS